MFQVATDATRSIDRAIAQPTNVNDPRRSGYERFYTLWANRSRWTALLPLDSFGALSLGEPSRFASRTNL
jgi:hypothetical protein